MKKILIIGSNFGSKIYLKILIKFYSNFKIYICSPNIYKKKINKNIVKCRSYEEALMGNNFQFVICVTTPNVQYEVVKFLHKKKIKLKGILLEKPLSSNFTKTLKMLSILSKIKIPFYINFIFSELNSYKTLKDKLLKKKINEINYVWSFRQAYFVNKIPTWKVKGKLGGGLVKYYGIHTLYHLVDLLNLDKAVKFKFVDLKFTKEQNTFIDLRFFKNEILINLSININSENNLHKINLKSKTKNFLLINKSKDWTKGFSLFSNNKQLAIKKENRLELTKKTVDKLLSKNLRFKSKKNYDYISKILVTHKLCERIYEKTKNKFTRKYLNKDSTNAKEIN